MGEAEEHQERPALEVLIGDGAAVLVGQAERPADRRDLRQARRAAAAAVSSITTAMQRTSPATKAPVATRMRAVRRVIALVEAFNVRNTWFRSVIAQKHMIQKHMAMPAAITS